MAKQYAEWWTKVCLAIDEKKNRWGKDGKEFTDCIVTQNSNSEYQERMNLTSKICETWQICTNILYMQACIIAPTKVNFWRENVEEWQICSYLVFACPVYRKNFGQIITQVHQRTTKKGGQRRRWCTWPIEKDKNKFVLAGGDDTIRHTWPVCPSCCNRYTTTVLSNYWVIHETRWRS